MDVLMVLGIVYAPIAVAIAMGGLGVDQARRGLRLRSFLRLAWGGSLGLTAFGSLACALWYYLDHTGMQNLWIIGAWYGPGVVIPVATLLLGSIATLGGAVGRGALERRGFRGLPRRPSTAAAALCLFLALAYAVDRIAIPIWHAWPYRTFSSTGQVDKVTLDGYPRFEHPSAREQICVIHVPDAGWQVRFSLVLDERGQVVVTTRQHGVYRSERTHTLPFEKAEYVLRRGELERL